MTFGQPTAMGLIPAVDPLTVARNFLLAVPTGMDDGLQEVGLGSPFGTTPAGPYGMGGPDVTLPGNIPAVTITRSTSSDAAPEADRTNAVVPSIAASEEGTASEGSDVSSTLSTSSDLSPDTDAGSSAAPSMSTFGVAGPDSSWL